MPEHRWSLLSKHAVIDKYTNLLSVFDVVDELAASEIPGDARPEEIGLDINGQIVSMWARSKAETPERFWQSITLTTPDGNTHDPGVRIEGDLRNHKRTRLIVGIKTVPFRGVGMYSFNIHHGKNENRTGRKVASVPLEIKLKEKGAAPEDRP